jgi:hypothetical protein
MSVFHAALPGLAEQIASILARDAAGLPLAKEAGDTSSEERISQMMDALDLSALAALREPFEEMLGDLATDGARRGSLTVRALVPGAADFALPSDAIATWAKDHAAALVGKRVLPDGAVIDNPNPEYAITEATRTMLRGVVADAFTEALSRPEIMTRLEQEYAFSSDRADKIARTEVSQALVQGNVEAWRASGVVSGKESILGSEHDHDDECDGNAAAGVIPIAAAFPSGHTAPPYHVRCVCDVLPVVMEG